MTNISCEFEIYTHNTLCSREPTKVLALSRINVPGGHLVFQNGAKIFPGNILWLLIYPANFWSKIEQWITDNLGLQFKFTVCEILLGIIFTQNDTLHIINYLILMGKWFINKKKVSEKAIVITEYLSLIKSKLQILSDIYNTRGQISKFKQGLGQIMYKLQ